MKNRILNIIIWLVTICYALFSIYWLIVTVNHNIIKSTIYIGIIIFSLYIISLFLKKGINIKINKKLLIIITLIISLGLRLFLLYLDYSKPVSDYATFFYNSIYVATGEGQLSSRYISAFPYLYSYIFLLGNFMKVFGINYESVILLNIILDLIGALLIYLFARNINKKISLSVLVLWLFNPFNIYFSTICSPVIAVNTFIALVLYISTLFVKNFNDNKLYIYAFLLGLSLVITNAFRPIMIIFIIAIFIYMLYYIFTKNKVSKVKLLISFFIIFIIYQAGNYSYFKIVSNITNYDINKSMSGWSLYVGSNYNANGEWSTNNIDIYNKYYNDSSYTPYKFNNAMMKLAINRYKENGIKNNLLLLIKKGIVLASRTNDYNYNSFISSDDSDYKLLECFVQKFTDIFWYLIIILNLIFSVIFIKRKDNDYKFIFLYSLFIIGFFLASLIVEVSPRYFYPIFPFMILISAIAINEISMVWKEKKM